MFPKVYQFAQNRNWHGLFYRSLAFVHKFPLVNSSGLELFEEVLRFYNWGLLREISVLCFHLDIGFPAFASLWVVHGTVHCGCRIGRNIVVPK